MSRNGRQWTTASAHVDDTSLNEAGSTHTWQIHGPLAQYAVKSDWASGYRYLRIQQHGKNSSGQTHYLSLSGFEVSYCMAF